MTHLLAWTPFIEPVRWVHDWWYLLLPLLAFGIAVIWKAVRTENMRYYWRSVTVMTLQTIVFMIGLAIALTILVQVIIPMLPAE